MAGLSLNRNGTLLLVNCHDRVIRLFELQPRGSLPEQAKGGCDEQQVAAALAQAKVGRTGAGMKVCLALILIWISRHRYCRADSLLYLL